MGVDTANTGKTYEAATFEVNARGTPWDLLLIKPYRDGGPAVNVSVRAAQSIAARVSVAP